MTNASSRLERRKRRQFRIRKRVNGSAQRPRLSVFRSSKHIYVQAVDDVAGHTLAAASTCEKDLRGSLSGHTGNRRKRRTRRLGPRSLPMKQPRYPAGPSVRIKQP